MMMADRGVDPHRRRLLGLLGATAGWGMAGRLAGAPARAASSSAPIAPLHSQASLPPPSAPEAALAEGARLIVAGPEGGTLVHWASALVPALEAALPPGTKLTIETLGAADGVTGANRFGARAAPDGLTLLLAPGEAAIDWLAGDPRAQFDAGHWVGVLAGTTSAMVMGRFGTDGLASPGGHKLRVAAAGPAGLDLPMLLGLDLLGIRTTPVFGLSGAMALQSAFAAKKVDLVCLRGHQARDQVAALRGVGAVPSFTLGALDEQGRTVPDPAFAGVPDFAGLFTGRQGHAPVGALYEAWRAAAMAARMEFGMILPQLTPAALVALWRRAGGQAGASLAVQTRAEPLGVHILSDVAATAAIARVAPDSNALLALREWLARHYNWHPG